MYINVCIIYIKLTEYLTKCGSKLLWNVLNVTSSIVSIISAINSNNSLTINKLNDVYLPNLTNIFY